MKTLKDLINAIDFHTNDIARSLLIFMRDNDIYLCDILCAELKYEEEPILTITKHSPFDAKLELLKNFMGLSKYYNTNKKYSILEGNIWLVSGDWISTNKEEMWQYHKAPEIPTHLIDDFELGYYKKDIGHSFFIFGGGVWVELDADGYYHYTIEQDSPDESWGFTYEFKAKEKMNPVKFTQEQIDKIFDYDSVGKFSLGNWWDYSYEVPVYDGTVTIKSNEYKKMLPCIPHLELSKEMMMDRDGEYSWEEER